MKTMKLGLLLILSNVYYLKEILTPKTNNLLKHPMEPGGFIRWRRCWFYMGCWFIISNWGKWWSAGDPKMSGVAPFRLNKYMSRISFKFFLGYIRYTDKNYVGYYDGLFHMRQTEEAWNLNTN